MVHGVELLLVSAIGGYWVLERAETHKGQLRSVGRMLGVVLRPVWPMEGLVHRSALAGHLPETG